MRRALLTALIVVPSLPLGASRAGADPATAGDASRVPVLVELFTSEGCSSCPRADALVRWLAATQPVPGVEIVALGEHVDYWDGLGWRDRFSSPRFTERQSDYQREVFHGGAIYTPQVVVDGASQAVGSDAAALRRALARAAERPKIEVAIAAGSSDADALPVTVRIGTGTEPAGPADVWLAVVEDGLVSEIAAGENRGRTLTHGAVVRQLEVVARLEAADLAPGRDGPVTMTATVRLAREWDRSNLRFIAFVQDAASRRVLGAGTDRRSGDPGGAR